LIDINVWLALTWDLHPQHAAAMRWHDSIGDAALIFCRLTMLGYLRLLTNRQVMGDSAVTVAGALNLYDQWRMDSRVELATEPDGTEARLRLVLSLHANALATKAVVDCYLAAFAEGTRAQLVTFDRGLAATAQARGVPVTLLRPDDAKPATRRQRR
jgi:toxin-antitoxin system PIN domain toxin